MIDPDQSDAPEHGHAHAAEAFPRMALRDLIAGKLRDDAVRGRWQTGIVTFALALLALGLPTTRLLGEGPNLVRWTDGPAWVHVHLLQLPVVKVLALLPGMAAERAWFLLSALCWAATYPVLHSTCRGLGASRVTAFVASCVTLLAPVVWLAGTLPGPSAAGLLTSAVLFRALLEPWSGDTKPLVARRWCWSWALAAATDLTLVLVFPAVVWAVLSHRRRVGKQPRENLGDDLLQLALAPLALGLGLVLAAWVLPATAPDTEFLRLGWYLLTGNAEQPISSALAWALILAPSLGVGAIGLWQLVMGSTQPEAGHRPGWLLVWCLFPFLFQVFMGRPNLDLATLVLGPVLAIGLADWLTTHERDGLLLRYQILAVSQVVVLLSFATALARGDPERDWTRRIRGELFTSDLVLTPSRTHHYLLQHRFRIEAVHVNAPRRLAPEDRPAWWAEVEERVAAANRARRRVVFDRTHRPIPLEVGEELDRVRLRAPVIDVGP